MASISRNKKMRNAAGRPVWVINYVGVDGRRHRERTEAMSRFAADKILKARLKEVMDAKDKGFSTIKALKNKQEIRFGEFFAKTYMPYVESRLEASTVLRESQLAKHVLPVFGKMPIRSIISGSVHEFITLRAGTTPRPSNRELNMERGLISRLLNHAFRCGLVDVNETARVRPLKEIAKDL